MTQMPERLPLVDQQNKERPLHTGRFHPAGIASGRVSHRSQVHSQYLHACESVDESVPEHALGFQVQNQMQDSADFFPSKVILRTRVHAGSDTRQHEQLVVQEMLVGIELFRSEYGSNDCFAEA
jgi:hypothetical protein